MSPVCPWGVGLEPLLTSHIVTISSLHTSPYHLPQLGRIRSTGVASPPFDVGESDVWSPRAEVADGPVAIPFSGVGLQQGQGRTLEGYEEGRRKTISGIYTSYDQLRQRYGNDNDF